MNTTDVGRDFVIHYGVKGMRWGVRNERSVTTTTRVDQGLVKRQTQVVAKGGQAKPATEDAVKAEEQRQVLKKSGAAALSNSELRELATRLQLEVQVQQLDKQTARGGKKFVNQLFGKEGKGTRKEVQQLVDWGIKTKKAATA